MWNDCSSRITRTEKQTQTWSTDDKHLNKNTNLLSVWSRLNILSDLYDYGNHTFDFSRGREAVEPNRLSRLRRFDISWNTADFFFFYIDHNRTNTCCARVGKYNWFLVRADGRTKLQWHWKHETGNKWCSGLIYMCLTLLVIKRKKVRDQRSFFFFFLQHISCTPLWIKPFPFLSIPPPTRAHTHTSWTTTQPWTVRHNQHEAPCYPVPPACLQMLQSCQPQPLSNPLTSYMFSPTLNHPADNNPTRAKQANCQVTRSYMKKIASKNLCAYPICHYEWQGPVEGGRQGRAEPHASLWKASFQHRGKRCWFQSSSPGQLQHWQLDRSTDWLSGVKETLSFMVAHAAPGWRRRVANQEKQKLTDRRVRDGEGGKF